eukprot:1775440-Pleurochrysis_carterae.AAC.2
MSPVKREQPQRRGGDGVVAFLRTRANRQLEDVLDVCVEDPGSRGPSAGGVSSDSSAGVGASAWSTGLPELALSGSAGGSSSSPAPSASPASDECECDSASAHLRPQLRAQPGCLIPRHCPRQIRRPLGFAQRRSCSLRHRQLRLKLPLGTFRDAGWSEASRLRAGR